MSLRGETFAKHAQSHKIWQKGTCMPHCGLEKARRQWTLTSHTLRLNRSLLKNGSPRKVSQQRKSDWHRYIES